MPSTSLEQKNLPIPEEHSENYKILLESINAAEQLLDKYEDFLGAAEDEPESSDNTASFLDRKLIEVFDDLGQNVSLNYDDLQDYEMHRISVVVDRILHMRNQSHMPPFSLWMYLMKIMGFVEIRKNTKKTLENTN